MSTSGAGDNTKSVFGLRIGYGWWVAVAGAFNMFLSSGPTFQAASVLFKAIEDEYGWSRAVISGVASFGRFGGALLGPVEGWMTDRFGAGKMVLLGFTIGGLGMIGLSLITGPIQYYLAFFALSVGFSIGGFTPSITSVNAWAQKRRATAMAIVIGGSSLAGLLVPPIVWSISAFGWRTTFAAIGVVVILAGPLIASIIGRRPPAETAPDEEVAGEPQSDSPRPADRIVERLYSFTPREALRTRAFWSISMTHMLTNFSVGAISAHLFLQLRDESGVGLDAAQAASVVPVMVVVAFISQLGGGLIGDAANKRVIVPFLILVQAISLVVLAFAGNIVTAMAFAVMWGIGFGGRTPMLHAMRGEYFGTRHFGTILGMSSFPMSIGMMLTPFIVGRIHDIQHTYQWSLLVLAAACVMAMFTVLFATRPVPPGERRRMAVRSARDTGGEAESGAA